MQAEKSEIYGHLVRQCRMLRMSSDVNRARAALDVEQELGSLMDRLGLPMPESPVPVRSGRRRRPTPVTTPQPAAVTGGAE